MSKLASIFGLICTLTLIACGGGHESEPPASTTSGTSGGISLGGSSSGSTSGGSTGGSCRPTGNSCSASGECCGFAAGQSECVNFGSSVGQQCANFCRTSSDCASGCCVPLKDGQHSVCAAPSFCGNSTGGGTTGGSCTPIAQSCTDDRQCCGFAQGLSECVNYGSAGTACTPTCHTSADCGSQGCCVGLSDGTHICEFGAACG